MNINKLRVLFLLDKVRINKQSKCPIRCRLTFSGKRKVFSTGLFVSPQDWNSKRQTAQPPSPENDYINTQLSLISQKINEAFLFLQVSGSAFTVKEIYQKYIGETNNKEKTILEVFEMHNQKVKNLIGKDYVKGTYVKFEEAREHTKNFVKSMYGLNDYKLSSIKLKFLSDFDYYLKTVKNHKQITINKTIQRLRKIIKLALAEGYILQDPFILYRPIKVERKITYLTASELKQLMEYELKQARLRQVKDMFIFCCYSGLPYNEMSRLKPEHIVVGFDNRKWIEIIRNKTGRQLSIPLLDKAEEFILKYEGNEFCFPPISNQKFNSYLKEIAHIVGIPKRLTHHMARRTFATTILLYNDVPMEIVSELLGHSKMATTQLSYGKVVPKVISNKMKELQKKLQL